MCVSSYNLLEVQFIDQFLIGVFFMNYSSFDESAPPILSVGLSSAPGFLPSELSTRQTAARCSLFVLAGWLAASVTMVTVSPQKAEERPGPCWANCERVEHVCKV